MILSLSQYNRAVFLLIVIFTRDAKNIEVIILGIVDSISMEVVEWVVNSIKHLEVIDCNL